jgi:hypothetical protein
MTDKSSFVLYKDMIEEADDLTDKQLGVLFRAILASQNDRELPEMDRIVKAIFNPIRRQIERDSEKYAERSKRNSENAKKPRKKATVSDSLATAQRVASDTDTVSDTDYDTDTDTDTDTVSVSVSVSDPVPETEPENESDGIPPLIPPGGKRTAPQRSATYMIEERQFPIRVEEAVKDWVKYKTEKRQAYKETGLKCLLTEIENRVRQHGEQAVIDVIRQSMGNNWQGIAWDHCRKENKQQSDLEYFLSQAGGTI